MGIPDLSLEQLDELPYGVIIVDNEGKISSYNRAEEQLSGRNVGDVRGKNFFTEVAPCTRVKEFHGRFQQFIEGDKPVARFNFVFRFKHGDTAVGIMIVRVDEEHAAITVKKSAEKAVEA
jgi:photoactive yellow protein